jgi:non-heme chloroperoxidase
MAITDRESQQVQEAISSARPTVVFIHGLWLLPSSWDPWAELFHEAGFATVTASWPDDPETVEQARANPEVFAGKTVGQVADHVAELIGRLSNKPAATRSAVCWPR